MQAESYSPNRGGIINLLSAWQFQSKHYKSLAHYMEIMWTIRMEWYKKENYIVYIDNKGKN